LVTVIKHFFTTSPPLMPSWMSAWSPKQLIAVRRHVVITASAGHATGFHARPHRSGAADVRARMHASLFAARFGAGALQMLPLIIVTKLILIIPPSSVQPWLPAQSP
jgi:hypothetical protein